MSENKNEYKTVQAESLGVETYSFNVDEIMLSIMSDLTETCSQIEEYTTTCRSDPNECQFSHEMLEVSKRTVEQLIHSMNTVSRV